MSDSWSAAVQTGATETDATPGAVELATLAGAVPPPQDAGAAPSKKGSGWKSAAWGRVNSRLTDILDLKEAQDAGKQSKDEFNAGALKSNACNVCSFARRQAKKINWKERAKQLQESLKRKHVRKIETNTSGNFMRRVLKEKLILLNGDVSARFNIMFVTLEANWWHLILIFLIIFCILSVIMAGFFWVADCRRSMSFAKMFFIVLGQLFTGPSFVELSDKLQELDELCHFLGSVSAFVSLILQAFVLSIAVRKFMKPKADLAFSRKVCVNSRDHTPCVQVRVLNLRGNMISNVAVRANWANWITSEEGETYCKLTPLEFGGSLFIKAPSTFTHVINEHSPLHHMYTTKHELTGSLLVEISGYDRVLDDELHQIWTFDLPGDVSYCSRFADTVIRGVQDAVKDGSYQMVVDLDNFNAVVSSHDSTKLCCICEKSGGVCPISGQALRLPRPDSIKLEVVPERDFLDTKPVPVLNHETVDVRT